MTQKLDFIIPIFDRKIKVRVGNIDELFDKYKPNLIPPCVAFFQPYGNFELICLSEDRWEEDLSHECGHLACELIRWRGMKVCDKTEELLFMTQDWLINYIKENL